MEDPIAGEDDLVRLLYYSRAAEDVRREPKAHMREILDVAVPGNRAAEVTGALLYCDGWFVQALEGARNEVGTVFGKISNDRRHEEVTRMASSCIDERAFSDWSMCGATLSPSDAAIVAVLEKDKRFRPDQHTPSSVLKLLKVVVSIKARDGAVEI